MGAGFHNLMNLEKPFSIGWPCDREIRPFGCVRPLSDERATLNPKALFHQGGGAPDGAARAVRAAQVDARYICQLRTVLTWRQSIGIVGGRPGASLYFIGFQNEHVLYLDPHEVQAVRPTNIARRTKGSVVSVA